MLSPTHIPQKSNASSPANRRANILKPLLHPTPPPPPPPPHFSGEPGPPPPSLHRPLPAAELARVTTHLQTRIVPVRTHPRVLPSSMQQIPLFMAPRLPILPLHRVQALLQAHHRLLQQDARRRRQVSQHRPFLGTPQRHDTSSFR